MVAVAADKGVILLSCGVRGNVIRFLPALTIPLELIDEGMAIVEASLAELETIHQILSSQGFERLSICIFSHQSPSSIVGTPQYSCNFTGNIACIFA